MAQSTTRKKPVAAMIVMGIVSIALYATLLLKQDVINEHLRPGRDGMRCCRSSLHSYFRTFTAGSPVISGPFWASRRHARKRR